MWGWCETMTTPTLPGASELFEHKRSARLPAQLVPRIRNVLGILEAARSPHDLNVSGLRRIRSRAGGRASGAYGCPGTGESSSASKAELR